MSRQQVSRVTNIAEQPSAVVQNLDTPASHVGAQPDRLGRPVSLVRALLEASTARDAEPSPAPYLTADVLAFVLDIQSAPTLVVDRNLRIIYANAAAETSLRQGGSLCRHGESLGVHSDHARTFADCVAVAGKGCPVKRSLILEGKLGQPSVAVWFRPIAASLQTSSPLWSHGLVALSFRVLSRPPLLSAALLRQHYGLTPRQAEVAARLALGASLSDIGAAMGVSVTTLRSHLSKAFEKTGTRGQPELIALVLSLASPVRD